MTRESSHQTVFELLPWYANQTLSREECELVEQHLTRCAHCLKELQQLYDTGTALKGIDEAVPDIEASLDRTMSAIEDWEKTRPRGLFARLWNPSIPTARLIFVAQFALILVMIGLVVVLPRRNDPALTTLSSGGSPAGGTRLTVMFEPNTTEATMRDLVRDVEGNIVAGPSALGVYVVELTGVPDTDARVEAAISKLRSNTAAVRFVERKP
jgi:hypothetical protein